MFSDKLKKHFNNPSVMKNHESRMGEPDDHSIEGTESPHSFHMFHGGDGSVKTVTHKKDGSTEHAEHGSYEEAKSHMDSMHGCGSEQTEPSEM